ncbi:hypothetical protein RYA07_25335, partial [Pseudomonas syringae pv. actinidiae]|nr:hypothetical protein [Pseudomonas syringae pv. actinidiae]
WPDERGIGGRMLVDWVAGWRGMRTCSFQRFWIARARASGWRFAKSGWPLCREKEDELDSRNRGRWENRSQD